ncbi:unnamed protein product [Amoebophrya sp. A120]|nr:unnamed protein product [Amoebophrya sp. A120]|eukprot:GSA120T00009479001.1
MVPREQQHDRMRQARDNVEGAARALVEQHRRQLLNRHALPPGAIPGGVMPFELQARFGPRVEQNGLRVLAIPRAAPLAAAGAAGRVQQNGLRALVNPQALPAVAGAWQQVEQNRLRALNPQAPAAAGAADAEEQTQGEEQPAVENLQPVLPGVKLIAPGVPVLGRGTTAEKLRSKLTDSEFERAPRVARRKFVNLQVNTWNLCAAKKKGYAEHGGMDAPVKGIIMQFLGDAPVDGDQSPQLSRTYLRELMTEGKRRKVKAVLDKMLPECKNEAARGNPGTTFKFRDIAIPLGLKPVESSAPVDEQWWGWLLRFLPTLREQIHSAGLELTLVPVDGGILRPAGSQAAPDEAEERKNKGKSEIRISWK